MSDIDESGTDVDVQFHVHELARTMADPDWLKERIEIEQDRLRAEYAARETRRADVRASLRVVSRHSTDG